MGLGDRLVVWWWCGLGLGLGGGEVEVEVGGQERESERYHDLYIGVWERLRLGRWIVAQEQWKICHFRA